jgi:SPP1 family predicted phage head-tail adaptor
MLTGSLNRNMLFQTPLNTPDGMGGNSVVWKSIFSCKGAYWPLAGAEAMSAMQMGGIIDGKVRIRFRSVNIPVKWRIIVDSSIILNIVAPPINIGGRREWMEIKTKEVV